MLPSAVFFLVFATGLLQTQAAVTNEDIRIAILQIVNVVRSTDDKLERHEYRDRLIGEQLKKGMINIDKRIKMLDPLKGAMSRLDERLAAVETILMQKDEKEKMQLQRTYEAVLDIQKNLPLVVEQVKSDIIAEINRNEPPAQITEPTMSKRDFEKMEKEVLNKMDKVSSTIHNLENELGKIRDDNKNLNDINNKSSENLEKVKRQLDTSEQLLSKYENKLAEYNNKIPEIPLPNYKEQEEWRDQFLKVLDSQKSQMKEILQDVKTLKIKVDDLPQRHDLDSVSNITLTQLAEIQSLSQNQPIRTAELIGPHLREVDENLNKTQEEISNNINDLSEITANLAESFSTRYEKIDKDMQALNNMKEIIVQIADNIVDTKRRVEYGMHQISAEVAKQSKENTKDINQGLSDRFDTFESTLLDDESGAIANLTSKIGEDIHQVWRQIGIMHQQMTTNTDTLNKLQNQTDAYVNGSLDVMDNMKGKVFQITGRMAEVDENLNYLLGRLSLVTQEFNMIKTGLGKALENIRDSFHEVQDKIEDNSKGPHKIASNEIVEPN